MNQINDIIDELNIKTKDKLKNEKWFTFFPSEEANKRKHRRGV